MKRAFTLTELMVVTAVIGILFTLMLPAVGKAISVTREASCKSQLKQIGYAVAIYHTDENDYTLPASFGETDDGHVNHFINYMISRMDLSENLFKCPSMRPDEMFDPDGHDPLTGNIYTEASYIMNIIKPGNWTGADGISQRNTAHGWGESSTQAMPLGLVTKPSEKLHIMDVIPNIANTHSGVNYFSRTDHGTVNSPPTGHSRWAGVLHRGTFNSVFGDGHVKLVRFSKALEWAVNR
ncbi:MAG: prepilin-type N-terminal cleavage/methylation domain-containing protein [Lentisphaeraceae bacterium]|nr:prepilin-type N-terminal cleavage/methylation domain-containing protein [Lentisphaeraceae bacterium]